MKPFSYLVLLIIISTNTFSMVKYQVSFSNPEQHYCEVSITVKNNKKDFLEFIMPVWTPGSYKVREFSRNVTKTNAHSADKNLNIEKLNKNTWKVSCKGINEITFTYQVYAFEMGVRTSFVDQNQAFLHGVSVFMYVKDMEQMPHTVSFNMPKKWSQVHVALPAIAANTYEAINYDLLADSPFALGNFDIIDFDFQNIKHSVVMLGEGNYDPAKIKQDFIKIIEQEVKIFDEHPCKMYVYFIQNLENGGGGLEHLNSQTSQMSRWGYSVEGKYKNFLSLIAHEYFHLWNVKRLRPIALGPFDYTKEVYTTQLWMAEGFTAYYDDMVCQRAKIYNETEYLNIVANTISKVENTFGSNVQSLNQSSFDAWIKAYIPDENSDNSTISYYQKGMLVALAIDLELIKLTNGKSNLDALMKNLYQNYYKKLNRGFTQLEFEKELNAIAKVDMSAKLKEWIDSTNTIKFDQIFNDFGLDMQNESSQKLYWGIKSKFENGRTLITYVESGLAASKSGLSVNDEIISINNWRVNGDIEDFNSRYKEGDDIEIMYNRAGKIYKTTLKLQKDKHVNYKLVKKATMTDAQKQLYTSWLQLK